MSWILVVEDEPALCADLVDYLNMRGFLADGVLTAADMKVRLEEGPPPSVVILDIGLPDADGFELASELRGKSGSCIIMLTARGEASDRIRGYDSGADLYLVKHTPLREIEAAIKSLLRRMPPELQPRPPASREWILDQHSWSLITPDQAAVKLTATEIAFLTVLMSRINQTCPREELAQAMTRRHAACDNRHLDAVVSRLRQKIAKAASQEPPIKVVYGVGYAFIGQGSIQMNGAAFSDGSAT